MPSPEDFYSATPPQRIIGTEMEYGLPCEKLKPVDVVQRVRKQTRTPRHLNQTNIHLRNGAHMYQELIELAEYAAPESLGPRDAVISNRAGQEIMRQAVMELETEMGVDPQSFKNALYRRVGFYLLNIAANDGLDGRPDYQGTGWHESLYARKWDGSGPANNYLGSSIGTRAIWAGSGMYYRGSFLTSQKNLSVGSVVGAKLNGTSERVMFRLSNDGEEGCQRVEVRSHEPVRDPYIEWLGYCATSLALRPIEYGLNSEMARLTLKNPVRASHHTAIYGLDALLETEKGTIRPMEYQHAVFESIDANINKRVKLPGEEQEALRRLLELTSTKSKQSELGWYPRWAFLSNKFSSTPAKEWPVEEAVYYDMMFDNLLRPHNSLDAILKLAAKIPGKRIDREVRKRMRTPPNTRAYDRGKAAPDITGWGSWKSPGGEAITQHSPYRNIA